MTQVKMWMGMFAGSLVLAAVLVGLFSLQVETTDAAGAKNLLIPIADFGPGNDTGVWENSGRVLYFSGAMVAPIRLATGRKIIGVTAYMLNNTVSETLCVHVKVARYTSYFIDDLTLTSSPVCANNLVNELQIRSAAWPAYKLKATDSPIIVVTGGAGLNASVYLRGVTIQYQ